MAPSGGYKGVNQALMVELLAAALSGANLGIQASPFSGNAGGLPNRSKIAIDPEINGSFAQQVERLCASITDQGARLPGLNRRDRMQQAEIGGVSVNQDVLKAVTSLAVCG